MASAFFKENLDKAKLMLGREPMEQEAEEEESSQDRLEELAEYCPTLTFQQRLIGFAISFGMGYMMSFFSFRFFIKLVEGRPLPFAINYSFGQILQICAGFFLSGPKRQFKVMFDEKRRTTSLVYLSCLATTVTLIFIPLPGGLKLALLLMSMLLQFCASVWYTLSYIPYGRRTALKLIRQTLGLDEGSSSSGPTTYAGVLS